MKRALTIVFACCLLAAQLSCTDYGGRIAHLQQQVERLEKECGSLSDNAAALIRLVEALQKGETLSAFEPIAEDGTVTGFRLVFEGSGEITVYNRASGIGVGEEDGRYYWMNGDEWLRDAAGGRVEVGARGTLPQFRTAQGRLEVSLDGGEHWQEFGRMDSALIEKVDEDAAQVTFTLGGGAVVSLAKQRALSLRLSGDDAAIGPGGEVTVGYTISGAEGATQVSVLCGDGWKADVKAETPEKGTIVISAPDPLEAAGVIVLAGDGRGRMVAVGMRLRVSEGGDVPEAPVLAPVHSAYEIGAEGGTINVEIRTNIEYDVRVSDGWVRYVGTKAERTDIVEFAVESNATGAGRSATVTFASANYTAVVIITQAQSASPVPVIVPEQGILEVAAEGGIVEMPVFTNTDFSVSANVPWVTYLGTKAIFSRTLRFEVAPNSSSGRAVTVYLRSGSVTASFVIRQAKGYSPPPNLPTLVSHIMPCCRAYNRGTTFLVNGTWTMDHSYRNISHVRDILQKIKNAGINVVCIDFSNASQWDSYGESAGHNGDGGEFWYQFGPMIGVIEQVCREKDMKFFFLIGNITTAGGISYWNGIAKRIWENWAQTDTYQRYGYGDDRPLLVCFLPGTTYAAQIRAAAAANKNYLQKFRVGTCQINSPITPTVTDGWGYRNYSQSSDGKVRFACPNGGVPPQDWYRVDAEEWQSRVNWAIGATEYAVIGSYDDTCDGIFWGIANVGQSMSEFHKNQKTVDNPQIYYDIVRKTLLGME